MSRKPVYAEDIPDDVYNQMKKDSYGEEAAFRTRMKGIEERATSGAVARPGASIAGMRVRVAHRMGDRFDVQVQDPFTKQMRTVVSHQYDIRGRRVGTDVAWTPGDPHSVAAVFGIPFVSAFGDLPKNKPQNVSDAEEVEKTRHDVWLQARKHDAKARAENDLLKTYANWVGTPNEYRIPPEFLERARKAKGGGKK